MMNTALEKSHI